MDRVLHSRSLDHVDPLGAFRRESGDGRLNSDDDDDTPAERPNTCTTGVLHHWLTIRKSHTTIKDPVESKCSDHVFFHFFITSI
jgi:hypothetical protein